MNPFSVGDHVRLASHYGNFRIGSQGVVTLVGMSPMTPGKHVLNVTLSLTAGPYDVTLCPSFFTLEPNIIFIQGKFKPGDEIEYTDSMTQPRLFCCNFGDRASVTDVMQSGGISYIRVRCLSSGLITWDLEDSFALVPEEASIPIILSIGARCKSCGDYNQYVPAPYTCYSCRQVSGATP